MKAIFCGHDAGIGCLEAMLEESLDITRIFSVRPKKYGRSTARIQRLARQRNIAVDFSRITAEKLRDLGKNGVKLVMAAGYPFRIPFNEGQIKYGINSHPTLLPEGRGPSPLPILILEGFSRSGVTIHKLSDAFDEGDILASQVIELDERETMDSLSCKVSIAQKVLLQYTLRHLEQCWEQAIPQGTGSYWKAPTPEQRTIHWDQSVIDIDRRVRAFGKSGAFARWDEKDWLVQDVSVWKECHNHMTGRVINRSNAQVTIAAADGYVCIRFFQAQSRLRRRLNVAARLAMSYFDGSSLSLLLR